MVQAATGALLPEFLECGLKCGAIWVFAGHEVSDIIVIGVIPSWPVLTQLAVCPENLRRTRLISGETRRACPSKSRTIVISNPSGQRSPTEEIHRFGTEGISTGAGELLVFVVVIGLESSGLHCRQADWKSGPSLRFDVGIVRDEIVNGEPRLNSGISNVLVIPPEIDRHLLYIANCHVEGVISPQKFIKAVEKNILRR